jgi:hypothetical protein
MLNVPDREDGPGRITTYDFRLDPEAWGAPPFSQSDAMARPMNRELLDDPASRPHEQE